MPDIQDGLEIDGVAQRSYEEGDVNTAGGFEAALARQVQGEVADPEQETPVEEPALEEEPLPGEEGDTEEVPEEEPAEDATQWRARYEEANRLIARQGQELGELRQLVQQRLDAPPPQQTMGPLDVEALIEENGGQKVIDWMIDNDPNRIEETARTWALSGDPEGAVFYADFRAEQARLEQPPVEQETDPALEQLATQQKLTEVWREARSDPNFADWEPGITPALTSQETPDEIKAMLVSGNLEHMRSAVQFLKPYAQLEAIRAGKQPAPENLPEPPQADTPAEQARREQIRRTAIVTGSQRLQSAGTQPEAGEETSEQRIARFKDLFDEEPSTSISAGLTINGQPVQPTRPRRS